MAATGGGMRRIPFKIAAIYGVLAALWILFTDAFVAASVPNPELQHTLSTLKGWAFVAVTAVILYVWMRRYVLRLEEEERAVRETNDRLTAIVDTVPSGILILDTSGRFTFANEVARRVLRLTGPHIIERTFDDAAWDLRTIDGQPLPRERVPFAVVMRTGEAVFDSRFTIAPPDGTPMLLSVNAAPLRDVHGAITSVLGTVDDVTEQYEAERRIVHTNRLYSMLSQTNEAIVRIRDVDELYAEACRITVEYGQFKLAWVGILDEATGAVEPVAHAGRDEGYLTDIRITVSEEDEQGHGPVGTAVRLGRTVLSNDVANDPYMRPGAKAALARGYRAVAAFPMRIDGKVFGSFNVYAGEPGFFDAEETRLLGDLTEDIAFGIGHIRQEKAREEAALDLRRWKDIFDNTQIGVMTMSGGEYAEGGGRIVSANAAFARMHGYSPEEVPGMPLAAMFTPESAAKLPERIAQINRSGHLSYETEHLRRDGSTFPVETAVTAVRDDGGRVLYRIANVQDITERRNAEEELARYREHLEELVQERTVKLSDVNEKLIDATEAKGRFLASMSHELRTPLNSIIGFTGIILKGMAGELNEEQRKQLGMVYDSGRQLLSLINDILDFSKIEAGRMQTEAADFEVGKLVGDVVAVVRPLAEEKGLSLDVEAAEPELVMHTDCDKVAHVLVNLLGNAVKFTEEGAVTLEARREGDEMAFTVSDTGIGIEAEDLDRIFEEFQQARGGVERRAVNGTGLGLAISRRLTEMLGGTISVRSEPAKGSRFSVRIPLRLPEPGASAADASEAGGRQS